MTIYDIAREAGVSASSVSRVINNKPGVREDTRRKINELLKKYNYIPNEVARGLVNKASRTIGILISDIRTIHYTDGAYLIENELTKRGFCCIFMNTGSDEKAQAQYISILDQRKVEGAILIGSSFQNRTVAKAINTTLNHVPVIIINGYLSCDNVYGVISDEEGGVRDCVNRLAKKGRKHFAFINATPVTPSNAAKEQGFLTGVRENPGILSSSVFHSANSIEGARQITLDVLEWNPAVDAIIYSVDLLASAGITTLVNLGKNIPADIDVVGIDNSIYAQLSNPPLSSIDNKLLESCNTAVHILEDCLIGRKNPRQIVLKTELVERQSTL